MRIVGFEEFLTLPSGTIYSDYVPHTTDGLYRKGENFASKDFLVSSIIASCFDDVIEVDSSESRWSLFDPDAKFAVYESDDIISMISMLTN